MKIAITSLRGGVADEAIQLTQRFMDCFAALAMTDKSLSHHLGQDQPRALLSFAPPKYRAYP